MEELHKFLHQNSKDGYIDWQTYRDGMQRFTCKARTIEKAIFESGLMPLRYKRNGSSLTQAEQHKLFESHVLIVGCGGLGGAVAALLARIGVGNITLMDDDVYEEHNLNRQFFSTPKTLGKPKAWIVRKGILNINPSLHVKAFTERFEANNANIFIQKKDVAIDALDNPNSKLLLATTCKEKGVAFVHGAISGWVGQCTTSTNLSNIYKTGQKGSEVQSGNLPTTANFCAVLQAAQTIKLLLNKPTLKDRLLFFDLHDDEFHALGLV
jgi:molybdopterin/thiamine biosynthesis adenylyltransferase